MEANPASDFFIRAVLRGSLREHLRMTDPRPSPPGACPTQKRAVPRAPPDV